jgi:hypothetical protein
MRGWIFRGALCALLLTIGWRASFAQQAGGGIPAVIQTPIALTDGATITLPCPTAYSSVTYYLTRTGINDQILLPNCPASANGLSVKFRINAGSSPFGGLTFASGFSWTGGTPYAICTAAATPNPACPAAEIANQTDWFGCDVVGGASASTEWDCWLPQYNVGAPPTWAFVNATQCASASGPTCTTGAVNMTGANLIVVAIAYAGGPTLSAVTDSSSNAYTSAVSSTNSSAGVILNCFYDYAPTVTSSMTFSANFGGSAVAYPGISVAGFSGAISSPLDQTNSANSGATGTATSQQTGSITPAQANELIVACLGIGSNGNTSSGISINNSYVLEAPINIVASTNEGSGLGYLIQGAAAATNPTFSWAGGAYGIAGIMSFK